MKNNRTFLEKLLDGAKVEWKPLKKVCNFISTGKLNANAMDENGIYPFFTCNEKPYKINNYAFDMEAILISGNGSQVGHLNYFKGKFNAYQRTYVIGEFDNNTLAMYLYHYLNFKLRDYITINSKKGSVPYITLPMLEKFEIPIPPLPVQTEIVKILDALTALTSELTSELILRRKQYEYYREKLLSFDSLELSGWALQWIKLIDLGELIRGNGLQKKDFTETGVPAIHYGQIYTYYGTFATKTKSFVSPELAKKLKKVDYGDVVITNTSENFEDVGKAMVYLGKEQAVTGGHATIFKPNHEKILSKYFVYLTQTSFFTNEKRKYAKGTKVIDVSATDMAKIILPIPPLEEQHRIVSILDKFETLTNSITEGLPLAIEQSQKRYEYYRELLLNFS